VTYEDFMKSQNAKKVSQPGVKVRTVENNFGDCKVLQKQEESLDYFGVRATAGGKKGKKGGKKKGKVNEVAKVFRLESPNVGGGRGGGRGGRGGGRGGRGGGRGDSRAPRNNDSRAPRNNDSRAPRNNDSRGESRGESRGRGGGRGGRGGRGASRAGHAAGFNFSENAFPTLGQ
jgi:hypothetical protein